MNYTALLLEVTSAEGMPEAPGFSITLVSVLVVGFLAAVSIGSIAWYNSKRPPGWQNKERPDFVPNVNPGDPSATAAGATAAERVASGTSQQKSDAGYDRNITSAETAARIEREGGAYKETPNAEEGDANTTSGYRVDREGLANNFAVEPEMYVNERGDLRGKEEALAAQRAEEVKEINEEGGKGPGVI